MVTHFLNIEIQYYQQVIHGVKKFELRENDHGFEVGDIVLLNEVINGKRTGSKIELSPIIYVLHGGKYGLEEGYCIFNW